MKSPCIYACVNMSVYMCMSHTRVYTLSRWCAFPLADH